MKLIDKLGIKEFIINIGEDAISKDNKNILFSIMQSLSGEDGDQVAG